MMLLLILSTIALALSARSKGYSALAWAFGGAFIGYGVMAFLPEVKPIMGKQRPGDAERREKGNLIGVILSAITLLIVFGFLAFLKYSMNTMES